MEIGDAHQIRKMASQQSDRAVAAAIIKTKPQRVRRRRRVHTGAPTLQFVTATDPRQFRDERTMRGVRSQAMIQYRYKAAQQKQKNEGKLSKSNPVLDPHDNTLNVTTLVGESISIQKTSKTTIPQLLYLPERPAKSNNDPRPALSSKELDY